jgi:quercetin dioxygenase-like cupin family protein
MKRLAPIVWVLALIASSVALAVRAADAPTIVMAGQEKFGPAPAPYPAAATMAVLSGDPTTSGSQYVVRLKLPDGTKILPHTHGDTENVTVLSGTAMVGLGTTFDASKMTALPAGSFVSIPAGTPHYAMAKGDTLLQVNGVGPASMTLTK